MSELAITEGAIDVDFLAEATGEEGLCSLEQQTEKTSGWLHNRRAVAILSLQKQAELEEDLGQKLKLVSQIFELQAAQVASISPEKMEKSFRTVRSLSLPEITTLSQRETDPSLKALFKAYISLHHTARSCLDEGFLKAMCCLPQEHRSKVKIGELKILVDRENNPYKKALLLKQLFARQLEKVDTPTRDKVLFFYEALPAKEVKEVKKLKDCPAPIQALLRTYIQLYKTLETAHNRDLINLLDADIQKSANSSPHLYFMELYTFESQLGFHLLGEELVEKELMLCSQFQAFLNLIQQSKTYPELKAQYPACLKHHQKTLAAFAPFLDQFAPKQTTLHTLLSQQLQSEDFSSTFAEANYPFFIVALHLAGKQPQEFLPDVMGIICDSKEAEDYVECVQTFCQASQIIARKNIATAKEFLDQVKTFVDQAIRPGWFSGREWEAARVKGLLEVARVQYTYGLPISDGLLAEVQVILEDLRYVDRSAIRKEYDYSYLYETWFCDLEARLKTGTKGLPVKS